MQLTDKQNQEQKNQNNNHKVFEHEKKIVIKKDKDVAKKVIMHAVKAAFIPMLVLLLKIIVIVLAISAMISLFNIVVNGDTWESNGEGFNSASIQSSGTDITEGIWKFTEDQINSFIDNYETSSDDLKTELKENASQIKAWQDNYGYSASVLITIAFEEGITDFDTFLTEMNTKGQEWKDAGYKTVNEIAQDYVGDETSEEWANNIMSKMQDVSMKAEIIKAGEEFTSLGDGYDTIYVSTTGKRYRNYKQNGNGSYNEHIFGYGKTIKGYGCLLTAITTIISGYKDIDINPKTAVIESDSGGAQYFPQQTLSYYGIQSTRNNSVTEGVKQNIRNTVENTRKPAVIRVTGIEMGGISTLTKTEHWVALLDYNSFTDEFYVSDPNKNNSSGWISATKVLTSCTNYIQVTN